VQLTLYVQVRTPTVGELARLIAAYATGRIGTPDDIAAATAFLLGPDASFITGTDLLVDGGVVAAARAGSAANYGAANFGSNTSVGSGQAVEMSSLSIPVDGRNGSATTLRAAAPSTTAEPTIAISSLARVATAPQELLGRGGMGEVWRAHDTETDRIVVIKLLPAHLGYGRRAGSLLLPALSITYVSNDRARSTARR
jgi:hypothetical protein